MAKLFSKKQPKGLFLVKGWSYASPIHPGDEPWGEFIVWLPLNKNKKNGNVTDIFGQQILVVEIVGRGRMHLALENNQRRGVVFSLV